MYQDVCEKEERLKHEYFGLIENKTRKLYNEYQLNSHADLNVSARKLNDTKRHEEGFKSSLRPPPGRSNVADAPA